SRKSLEECRREWWSSRTEAAEGRLSRYGPAGPLLLLLSSAREEMGGVGSCVGSSLGVVLSEARLARAAVRPCSRPVGSVLVRLRTRLPASSEPTSLPKVRTVLDLETVDDWPSTSSCRALIFCHVFSLRPTGPRSSALRKRDDWSMPSRT